MQEIQSDSDQLVARLSHGTATVILNNPEKMNAISLGMLQATPSLVRELAERNDVRVVVITGAGTRAFASGADISEFGESRNTVAARNVYDAASAAADEAWDLLEKPVIAMIRGYCIGKGLLTAMKADVRIAADNSSFAIPAARLGLGYSYRNVEALARLVGTPYAAEMLFTGRRLSAQEGFASGLVNWVVPEDDLAGRIDDLTTAIVQNAPLTVAACKVALREFNRPAVERNFAVVNRMVESCFLSDDYQEGQRAFAEKRPPQFTGN